MRALYIVAICALAALASLHQDDIVISGTALDKISYWGTIATIAGLSITLIEVLHNIRITKSINHQARKMLLESKKIYSAALVSECAASLDDTNNYISAENYPVALKCFQHFRKSFAKIYYTSEFPAAVITNINTSEMTLQKAVHTSGDAPLPKRQKSALQSQLVEIKSTLESTQPIEAQ